MNTAKCKIPNVNPWNSEVKPLYVKRSYVKCADQKKLTEIVYETDGVFLEINEKVKLQYSDDPICCCYSNISRGEGETPDLGIR